jgi:general secretion pathway protein C
MVSRWAALAVWAAVAASVVFWALRLWPAAPAPAAPVVASAPPAASVADLQRLLGTDPPPPPPPSEEPVPAADARFQLVGVLSPRSSQAAREGVALIAVDGEPARAYRIGAAVSGETVLQAVAHNRVTLGPRGGPAQVALELAPPAAAATGTLPGVGSGAGPGAAFAPGGFPPPAGPAAGPTAGTLSPMRAPAPRPAAAAIKGPMPMALPQQPFPAGTTIVTTDTGEVQQERTDADNRPLQ